LNANEKIEYATPVLLRVVQLHAPTSNTTEYVIAAGVVPTGESNEILGVQTAGLTAGDPHFANGTYNGSWTGEVAASDAAATLLDVSAGQSMTLPRRQTNRSLRITNVSAESYSTGAGPLPIVVMHQSELQSLVGATGGDPADQILVSTNAPGVRPTIEALYPNTNVVQKSGFSARAVSTSSLPVAIALTAVLTAVVVGTLFVATMMGLELHADRRRLAVLAAVGYRTRSRALLVVAETFVLTFVGAGVGAGLGIGGIVLTNQVAGQYLGVSEIAIFDPILVGAAGVVAFGIAGLASIYPTWLTRRTDVLEVLG
jgi:putative ABC transport system permease protein